MEKEIVKAGQSTGCTECAHCRELARAKEKEPQEFHGHLYAAELMHYQFYYHNSLQIAQQGRP